MLTFLFVVVGLSLLIVGHEAGHFFVAKFFRIKVEEFGLGFPPRAFVKRKGETEYSLNWLPFGGFVRIAGENDRIDGDGTLFEKLPAHEKARYFLFQPAWRRILIVLAGVTMNFLIGWFLLSLVLILGIPQELVVSDVQPQSPAAYAGVMAGDVIQTYTRAQNFIDFVNTHRGELVTFQVKRGEQLLTFTATPRTHTAPGEGALGVALGETGEPRHGFVNAVSEGLSRALQVCLLTFQGVYALLKNLFIHGSLLKGVVGPVGIFGVAEYTGRLGFIYLVQLLSFVSLNLTVVNLIPFPALDGGRFLMIVIEKVKGSPISRTFETLVNSVGFALLVLLMILLTIRDISQWW